MKAERRLEFFYVAACLSVLVFLILSFMSVVVFIASLAFRDDGYFYTSELLLEFSQIASVIVRYYMFTDPVSQVVTRDVICDASEILGAANHLHRFNDAVECQPWFLCRVTCKRCGKKFLVI